MGTTISFGLPFELGDCPYGNSRLNSSLSRLHKVVDGVEDWMGQLEPRNEKELPLLNVARQLLSESSEFATAVADCACRGNLIAAYGNLRPLIERKLHLKNASYTLSHFGNVRIYRVIGNCGVWLS